MNPFRAAPGRYSTPRAAPSKAAKAAQPSNLACGESISAAQEGFVKAPPPRPKAVHEGAVGTVHGVPVKSPPQSRPVRADVRAPLPKDGTHPPRRNSASSSHPAAARSSTVGPRLSNQVPAKEQSVPRRLEQKGGFSVLAPDPKKHQELLRRQRLSEQGRPKPKASEMRFSEVLDAGAPSGPEREAARQRWIEDMQAKADPKQIRRAARDREEKARELEREHDRVRRQEFEQQYYERQAAQQEHTSQLNAQARRHWAEADLPEVQQPGTEVVMPPEDVDFGKVRRELARRSASLGPRTSAGYVLGHVEGAQESSTVTATSQARTRSGALALSAQAAERRREAEKHASEAQSSHAILTAQDAEYQVSLANDQLKALTNERERLRIDLEMTEQQRGRAEDRLARYGDNPRLQAEVDEARNKEVELQSLTIEIEHQVATAASNVLAKEQIQASLGNSHGT